MTNYLLSRGYKKWEKKDSEGKVTQCRIYINDLSPLMEEIGHPNPKGFRRGCEMYYNVLEDKFYYSASSSRKESVIKLIEYLRDEALNLSLKKEMEDEHGTENK